MVDHRGPEFTRLFAAITRDLQALYRTEHDLLIFTCSGTGGLEAAVANLFSAGEKVLLVLTHRRLPDRGTMVGVASGWHNHLGVLRARLEGRAPRPFWSTQARLKAAYEQRLPA